MYKNTNYISFSLLFRRSVFLAFLILPLILPYTQKSISAQERIAVISKFTGDVKILHEGKELSLKRVGPRILNSSLFDSDVLKTGKGATAEITYADGSVLQVEENASIDYGSRELSEAEQKETGRLVARVINIKGGNVSGSIFKSKTVLTEFETPSGVASVRGTEISLDVGVNPDTGVPAVLVSMAQGSAVWATPGATITTALEMHLLLVCHLPVMFH